MSLSLRVRGRSREPDHARADRLCSPRNLRGLSRAVPPDLSGTLARPDDDDDGPRDDMGLPVERPHWKVRLMGLGMIGFGLLWIYLFLFGKPADEPALI